MKYGAGMAGRSRYLALPTSVILKAEGHAFVAGDPVGATAADNGAIAGNHMTHEEKTGAKVQLDFGPC